jgi:hypothetical protein
MVTGRLSPNSWRGGSSGVAAIRGSRRLVDRNANNPRLNDGSRPAIVTVDVAAQYQHVPWRGTLGFQHRQGWQGYGDPTEDEIETSASNNFSAIFRARGWASSTMTWRLTQKKILCGAVRCCFGKATGRRARGSNIRTGSFAASRGQVAGSRPSPFDHLLRQAALPIERLAPVEFLEVRCKLVKSDRTHKAHLSQRDLHSFITKESPRAYQHGPTTGFPNHKRTCNCGLAPFPPLME